MGTKATVATDVEIFGAVYHVRGEKDPEYLQELADHVDRRMRQIADQVTPTSSFSTERCRKGNGPRSKKRSRSCRESWSARWSPPEELFRRSEGRSEQFVVSPVWLVMGYVTVEPTLFTRESCSRAACASPDRTGTLTARGAGTHLSSLRF